MNFSKKLIAILALVPGLVFASEGGVPLDRAPEPPTWPRSRTGPSCSSITA